MAETLQSQLLTTAEAAKILGLKSSQSVRDWIKAGKIPAICIWQPGRYTWIRRGPLEKWLAGELPDEQGPKNRRGRKRG